jgi:hypothetical protein
MRIIGLILGLFIVPGYALDKGAPEELVQLSRLTMSAIECSILATDNNEAQRLGDIGVKTGKEFLSNMRVYYDKLTVDEKKHVNNNVAILWHGVSGPSDDFVMGRVWQELEHIVYKRLGDNTTLWDVNRNSEFAAKNCSLIK